MFNQTHAQKQMEKLNRGLIAVKVNTSYFLSWRLFGTDATTTAFNVYKGTTKLNATPITLSTTYTDNTTTTGIYTVRKVENGIETETSEPAKVYAANYFTVALNKPAAGTTPAYSVTNSGTLEDYPNGQVYSYNPNDCSTGDLDGDGEYEIVLKWDPTNSRDNSQGGITGNVYLDAYKLNGTFLWRIDLGKNIRAGAHYTQFMVYDLDGDGKAEIACKTAPGTKDGKGNFLSKGNAATDDDNIDYRTTGTWPGFISSGNEYLTIFSGLTGEELITTDYAPNRAPANGWGKTSETTNRVDRFLACIAYLDGQRPSLVMCRGYYGRMVLVAWDWRNGALTKRWTFDSGTTGSYISQGNHNLSVADVDADGKDEIIYGSSAFDDNGTALYTTGLGHGDAIHVSDLDPDRAGLEVWEVHEEKRDTLKSSEMHDAKTGQIIFGLPANADVGRGLAADIDGSSKGFEVWSSSSDGVYTCKGVKLNANKPSINFRVYWDGDLQDEILDGTKLDKWNGNGTTRLYTLYNYSGAKEINGTKANPCLQADLFGDWREELVYYNSANSSELVVFTSTIATTNRIYTLMHDPHYRLSVAWQNVAYNQPPHLGFYIGDGITNIPKPNIVLVSANTTKTQTIALQVGWNLISTNLDVTNNTIESIFTGLNVEEIKNANGFWKKGQNSTLHSLKTITAGEGYLVKMNVAGNLVITGIPISIVAYSPISTLKTGWNLIGCPFQTVTPFSTAYNASNCQTIKNFTGFWIPNGTTNSLSIFEPGKGYFLKK